MQRKMKFMLIGLAASSLLAGCSSIDLNPNPAEGGVYTAADFNNPNSPLSQKSIYFDFDSYAVPADAQAMVEAHAVYLSTHPTATVVLEGNTDERGGREYNLALGQKRSDAVKNRLQLLGVPAVRKSRALWVRTKLLTKKTVASISNIVRSNAYVEPDQVDQVLLH